MSKKDLRFIRKLFATQKRRGICTAVLALIICMLHCACTNNVNSMIEDYNGHFLVETENNTYSVDNVYAEQMLRPSYAVSYLTTICLVAPEGGASYDWTVEVYENADKDKQGTTFLLGGERILRCYLRNSPVKRWGSYKITLTVTKKGGELMKDTAWLYVY